MSQPAQVQVVPHTHWDREWYLPFAVYRRRLLRLMDGLLAALADEPGLVFHLDGQMALVDDYLELRPERQPQLRAAAAAGRLSLGPWYTLADEHLVSGECLIRNLELGQERARRLGQPLAVGYLPDQFGHTAQMPQLLRRAGIETAVLWRGVPAAVAGGSFSWEALDGSAVEAVHLARGYGHGRALPVEATALAERLSAEVQAQVKANPTGPWLVMAGDDHLEMPTGLAEAVAALEPERGVVLAGLAEHLAARPASTSSWRGELHSAATARVLKGTLSTRFPLKLRQAALERRLERYLEPAWALNGRNRPGRELAYIWRQLILNSAHDTICGCSIDQVHEEQAARLDRGERLADGLWSRLGEPEGWFNPSPFAREGIAGLSVGSRPAPADVPVPIEQLGLWLEDGGDVGDEYTYQPPPGDQPRRLRLAGRTAPLEGVEVEASAVRREGEPFVRLRLMVENARRDHRLRLLLAADTVDGAWAGVAFGAVQRPYRAPGSEPGQEYDLRTDPARGWVDAGGTCLLVAGPFEYELTAEGIALTLLRCVGWLSRSNLSHRPGHAGPGLATPGAQMLGRHHLEVAVLRHQAGWREDALARWAEVFALPLLPAPAGLRPGPAWEDPTRMLSALRRIDDGVQLRTYSLDSFQIADSFV